MDMYFGDNKRIKWSLCNTYYVMISNLFAQDFEALTPNLMARTVETVEGGGLIVFLLKSMDSLRQLHSITMDVHSRYVVNF